MLQTVFTAIEAIEAAVAVQGPSAYNSGGGISSSSSSSSSSSNYSPHAQLLAVEKEFDLLLKKRGGHPTEAELLFWVLRIAAVVSLLVLLLFLFIHDY